MARKELPIERFMRLVNIDSSGCWLWIGALNYKGYGVFNRGDRNMQAHRFSYEHFIGSLGNKQACHTCDVRSCVNPEHIFPGTAKENTADMMQKDRHSYGERRPEAVLSESDVIMIRSLPIQDTKFARQFNVARETIRDARTGRTWKHL